MNTQSTADTFRVSYRNLLAAVEDYFGGQVLLSWRALREAADAVEATVTMAVDDGVTLDEARSAGAICALVRKLDEKMAVRL